MMNVRKQQTENNVAIYCRLSSDDGNQGDSQSIQNQKQYLRKYVLEQGWQIFDFYIDDGYSGTNFDRPGFNQMIKDIELGFINIVITKDLSRLGRDYIKTGEYTEKYFPEHNVRYIALNDNVDTINEDGNEFAPFKNIINEWYAKDVSKKVRFTLNNQMKTGKQTRTTLPIYGYMFNEKGERLIDPESSLIVKRIFKRFLECHSTALIAEELKKDKILLPTYYNNMKTGVVNVAEKSTNKYGWTRQKVYRILHKEEYTGTYIRGKTRKRFKNPKNKRVPEEEQFKFEDAFEAIISKEDFKEVQEQLKRREDVIRNTDFDPFRGLVKCGICGHALRIQKDMKYDYVRVFCRASEGLESPSLSLKELYKIVELDLTTMKEKILKNKSRFLKLALEYTHKKDTSNKNDKVISQIANLNKRLDDLKEEENRIFMDYHSDKISRDTYLSLIDRYSKAIADIKEQKKQLESNLNSNPKIVDYVSKAEDFIRLIENIDIDFKTNPKTLSLIYEGIYIKCEPVILKSKKRPLIIDTYVHAINDIVKEFLNEK